MAIDLDEAEKRITKLEQCTADISTAVSKIVGQMSSVELILKWVVLPLLLIVGGLVGVKIAVP